MTKRQEEYVPENKYTINPLFKENSVVRQRGSGDDHTSIRQIHFPQYFQIIHAIMSDFYIILKHSPEYLLLLLPGSVIAVLPDTVPSRNDGHSHFGAHLCYSATRGDCGAEAQSALPVVCLSILPVLQVSRESC